MLFDGYSEPPQMQPYGGKIRNNWDQKQKAKALKLERRRAKNKAARESRKRNR